MIEQGAANEIVERGAQDGGHAPVGIENDSRRVKRGHAVVDGLHQDAIGLVGIL